MSELAKQELDREQRKHSKKAKKLIDRYSDAAGVQDERISASHATGHAKEGLHKLNVTMQGYLMLRGFGSQHGFNLKQYFCLDRIVNEAKTSRFKKVKDKDQELLGVIFYFNVLKNFEKFSEATQKIPVQSKKFRKVFKDRVKGVIALHDAELDIVILSPEEIKKLPKHMTPYEFVVKTPKQNYNMIAESEQDRWDWMNAISSIIAVDQENELAELRKKERRNILTKMEEFRLQQLRELKRRREEMERTRKIEEKKSHLLEALGQLRAQILRAERDSLPQDFDYKEQKESAVDQLNALIDRCVHLHDKAEEGCRIGQYQVGAKKILFDLVEKALNSVEENQDETKEEHVKNLKEMYTELYTGVELFLTKIVKLDLTEIKAEMELARETVARAQKLCDSTKALESNLDILEKFLEEEKSVNSAAEELAAAIRNYYAKCDKEEEARLEEIRQKKAAERQKHIAQCELLRNKLKSLLKGAAEFWKKTQAPESEEEKKIDFKAFSKEFEMYEATKKRATDLCDQDPAKSNIPFSAYEQYIDLLEHQNRDNEQFRNALLLLSKKKDLLDGEINKVDVELKKERLPMAAIEKEYKAATECSANAAKALNEGDPQDTAGKVVAVTQLGEDCDRRREQLAHGFEIQMKIVEAGEEAERKRLAEELEKKRLEEERLAKIREEERKKAEEERLRLLAIEQEKLRKIQGLLDHDTELMRRRKEKMLQDKRRLEAFMKVACTPIRFYKHPYHSGFFVSKKPVLVKVENKKISWKDDKKSSKKWTSLDIIHLHRSVPGARTGALKNSKDKNLKKECCFSVVHQTRTLDLECPDKNTRDFWCDGIELLIAKTKGGMGFGLM